MQAEALCPSQTDITSAKGEFHESVRAMSAAGRLPSRKGSESYGPALGARRKPHRSARCAGPDRHRPRRGGLHVSHGEPLRPHHDGRGTRHGGSAPPQRVTTL